MTAPGRSAALRDDPTWLPDAHRVALRFTEPDHGLTAIYDDGHLIELAICETGDLTWFCADTYAVLVGGEVLSAALRETNERAIADRHEQDPDGAARYHRLVKELVISTARIGRGEHLSATHHLYAEAMPRLLDLIVTFVPATGDGRHDPFDPSRRLESTHPAVAGQLAEASGTPADLIAAVCTVVRRELSDHVPAIDPTCLELLDRLEYNASKPQPPPR